MAGQGVEEAKGKWWCWAGCRKENSGTGVEAQWGVEAKGGKAGSLAAAVAASTVTALGGGEHESSSLLVPSTQEGGRPLFPKCQAAQTASPGKAPMPHRRRANVSQE
eukprot:scaffold4561_cov105-Isochrysis_galbana.AAC.1